MLPLQVWVQMLCDVVQVCCINVTELYKSGDILYCYPSTQQDCYRPATHHRHAAGLYNIWPKCVQTCWPNMQQVCYRLVPDLKCPNSLPGTGMWHVTCNMRDWACLYYARNIHVI